MNTQKVMEKEINSDKGMYKLGGIAAIIVFIGYFIIIALYSTAFPPSGSEERLIFFAGHMTEWWAIISLSVLTNFLRLFVFFHSSLR